MIVIADATPLNYLVLVGHADILPKLFVHIVIPSAVMEELQRPRTPEVVRAWVASRPAWLDVRSVENPRGRSLAHLGAGEREAILLAEDLHADWLIMDDSDGRQEAVRRNLPVIGTLRVLDEAGDRGLIDLPEALKRLEQTTFYVSPDLLQWLMNRHAKRSKSG
jgi:predicted nucleic acid-binding protein